MRDVSNQSAGIFDLGQIWQLTMLPMDKLDYSNIVKVKHLITILRDFGNWEINKKELPDTAAMCQSMASKYEEWIQGPNKPVYNEQTRNIIIRDIDHLRSYLYSELGKLTILVLEEKYGYSVNTLWKHQFNLIKGVTIHLSEFVKSNIIESSKCFVLNCYTAVGFHSMRALEHVARRYYELIIGKPPKYPDGRAMGLGAIAQELIQTNEKLKKSHKASDDLLIIASIIKGLTKKKRDPLAHPQIVCLKENEARETFVDALQVISKVVEDAKVKGPHFVTPWKRGYLF